MAGIKKIARPINKAKNEFVKWLKQNGATDINIYTSPSEFWKYYKQVYIRTDYEYTSVEFMIRLNRVIISYTLPKLNKKGIVYSVEEFLELIK